MSWSLRRRLTGVIAALVAIVLAGLAVVLYVVVRQSAWQQYDTALVKRVHALAAIAEFERGGYEMALPPDPGDEPASFIELWQSDGSVVARSTALGNRDLDRQLAESLGVQFVNLTLPDGRPGRAVGMQFMPRDERNTGLAEPLRIVVADGTEEVTAAIGRMRWWFLVLGLSALIAITAVTAWSLRRGFRTVARLAAEIERIDDTRLATQFSHGDQPVELAVMVRKLDELLRRLDASFARERQFTADVSHELRTPVAGLQTLLEVTALEQRSAADYRGANATALAIVRQLGALVENLLALARLDAGQIALSKTRVDLRTLVEECWRPYADAAQRRALEFRNAVPPDAITAIDGEKLRIVVRNLLANAAEYTEHGGWIEVTAGSDVVLEVTDSGPALALADLDHVFDRLWRGDVGRTETGIHCGIGLSLSRGLCELLSLNLTASCSTEGRVSFRIA